MDKCLILVNYYVHYRDKVLQPRVFQSELEFDYNDIGSLRGYSLVKFLQNYLCENNLDYKKVIVLNFWKHKISKK